MSVAMPSLADLITTFFTRHLAAELNASAHTITSYRDTFRLLLIHAATSTGRQVSRLALDDLAPDAILHFLEFLEQHRGNSVRTRNTRLAAIRSFFAYVVSQEPVAAPLARRVLHIPFKKTTGRLVAYLPRDEVEAVLAQPDRTTPKGRRDYLMLALLYDTGGRIQEVLNLCPADFRLDRLPLVRIAGKGRKLRIVPLLPTTATLVKNHLQESDRSPCANNL
jgi:site-specific recombinase XerD